MAGMVGGYFMRSFVAWMWVVAGLAVFSAPAVARTWEVGPGRAIVSPEQVAGAVSGALEALGQLDVLVNNAGGPLFNAPFLEIRPEGWSRLIDLNLVSVVNFCRAVGGHRYRYRAYDRRGNILEITASCSVRRRPSRSLGE